MTRNQLKNKIKEILREEQSKFAASFWEKGQPLDQTVHPAKFMSDTKTAKAAELYPDSEDLKKHMFLKDLWKRADDVGHRDDSRVMGKHLADRDKEFMTDFGLHPDTVIDQGGFSSAAGEGVYPNKNWWVDGYNRVKEEDELEEMNDTASVGGEYMTPMAFSPKKKKKKFKEGTCGYGENGELGEEPAGPHLIKKKKIKEELEPKDVQQVRKIVKEIINNMFRDIWLKRNSWNRI